MRQMAVALVLLAVATGCGDSSPAATVPTVTSRPASTTLPATSILPADGPTAGCADVIGAEAVSEGEGTYLFRVTVRSADTGPEKYADAWQVRRADGTVLGERILLHDHVNEQPFTRTLGGVVIPADTTEVVVAARDSVEGFCGAELVVPLG